jgi:hypothetical protein
MSWYTFEKDIIISNGMRDWACGIYDLFYGTQFGQLICDGILCWNAVHRCTAIMDGWVKCPLFYLNDATAILKQLF